MTTLTLITTDVTLIGNWQALSPQVVDTVPDTIDDVWLLDCTSLPTDTIRAVIEQAPLLCFALVDNQALLNIGGVLFDSDIPILKKPLTAHGRATIEQALSGTENDLDATQTRPTAFTGLAQEFALRSTDVRQFTHKIATAVKDMMKADWVAFVSVTFDQTENYSADVLAMVGDVPEDHADNVVRPNGFTLHILKTQLPVVMPDARTFKLDDIQVNPRTLEAGFRAGLGLPLLLQDGEPFGVMWVMYNEPHLFTYADVRHMQVYASHVALAYSYHVQKKLVGQWQIAAQRIFTRPLNHHTLTETLDYITTGIHDSLDCDAVMLFFREYEGDAYQVFHDGTMDVNQYDLVRLPLFHEMTQADEPLILDNAPADTRLTDILPVRQGLVQSVVLMPLAHANQSIGLIWLHYHDARHFTEEEATAIKLFADQIAVSITNAVLDAQQNLINQKNNDLIQQLQEQGEQLRNLVKVIDIERNLNNQDRQAILKTIARQTCVAADADRVTIRLVQDDHVAALAVYPETDDDIDVKQSVNWQIRVAGHSQYIVETNQPVIIPDVDNYDPNSYSGIEINPRWRGVWKARIGLPLTSGEKTIGVMWLSFKHARPVTSSQLSAFQSFANIAFLTKMYDIEQERLQHALRLMQRAHQTINTATEIDLILQQTMHIAQEIVSTRDTSCRSFIGRVNNQQVTIHRDQNDYTTFKSLKTQHKFGDIDAIVADDRFAVTHAIALGETLHIDQFDVMHHNAPLLLDTYTGSQLYVPIYVGDRVTAIVGVESTLPHAFEWYDQATLEWLASFVGQVIHNHQQQQMRQALFESSQAITASKNLPTVLQTIAEQAHGILQIKQDSDNHDAFVCLHDDDAIVQYPQQSCFSEERVAIGTEVMQQNQAQIINTFPETKDSTQSVTRSLLVVPIPNLTDEQPALGVINVRHCTPDSFDDDDLKFMTLFAKFASVAIRRARESDAQDVQRQSFFELTRAAMDQVIASHDLNNFRMIYKFELPRLREHIETVLAHEEGILKAFNHDVQVFDALAEAMEALPESLRNLQETYQSRIDHDAHIPELGDNAPFPLLGWLQGYHKAKHVHLQIDPELTAYHQSRIPKYWLQEVIKILLTNARRALRQGNLINDDAPHHDNRLIEMTVTLQADTHQVEIRITNAGQAVPISLQPLLGHQVIPKHLRSDEHGRGIGLFMSGIILRAYEGNIYYDTSSEYTTFVLNVPLA